MTFFFPNFYLLVSSFISTYVWFTTLYSVIQIKFKLHPLFYGLTLGVYDRHLTICIYFFQILI